MKSGYRRLKGPRREISLKILIRGSKETKVNLAFTGLERISLTFQTPELTAEEQEQRLKKAEAIRKMLSETTVTAPEGGGT